MKHAAGFLSVLAFLLLSGCSGNVSAPVRVQENLMPLVLQQCAVVPRHSGSDGARRTAEWIAAQAGKIPGVRVRIDEFQDRTPEGEKTFRNVICELPGRSRELVLIGAHYDTKRFETFSFQGANDGGSGTAVLLGMMRAVAERDRKNAKTLRFLFFDGEESLFRYDETDGLHGSRRCAAELRRTGEAKRTEFLLLLDMVGDRDLHLTLPADTPETLSSLALRAASLLPGGRDRLTKNGPVMLDDHVPFRELGIPSLLFIDFDYGRNNLFWHSPSDTPQNVSEDSLRFSADLALETLRLSGAL